MIKPGEIRYDKHHQWIRLIDNNTVTVGITPERVRWLLDDDLYGTGVYTEMIRLIDLSILYDAGVGREESVPFMAGQKVGFIIGIAKMCDVFIPLNGYMTKLNNALGASSLEMSTESLQQVRDDPFGAGWLFEIQPWNYFEDNLDQMMTAQQYDAFCNDGEW